MSGRDRDALLSLGSNVAPGRWIPRALERIEARFALEAVSPCYQSPAVGGTGSYPDFVNLAVRIRTDCPPRALKEACRRIEEACGRRRTSDRYAPRTVDLDIALMGDLVLDLDTWRLPDPLLADQAFVLVPCADLSPDAVHPERHVTLARLVEDLSPRARGNLRRLEALPAPDRSEEEEDAR